MKLDLYLINFDRLFQILPLISHCGNLIDVKSDFFPLTDLINITFFFKVNAKTTFAVELFRSARKNVGV